MDSEKINSCHISALEKSMLEYERLTEVDPDINIEYESLVNEIRGIYSDYLIMNQNKKQTAKLSLKDKFNMFWNPSEVLKKKILKNLSDKKSLKLENYSAKNPNDIVQATLVLFSLVFFLFTSYLNLFNDLLSNFNINYSTIFSYGLLFLKCLAGFFSDFSFDFFSICLANFKNLKNKILTC